LLTHPDEPFSGIVLIPSNGITIVHGKLVVEIVITLADSDESGDKMVARRVFVIKRRIAKPMRERVDAECRLNQ
jgi:hypothetical protein